ncbi:MAG: glutamine synthetase family protein [Candidatus Omnitrophica bacterium]|nr:glutamine synthetase family protein [Candidatus Omnitrophota bacterium]MCM8828047.1 glutamine synthetase family protein [Candidatus Omnitrophota bacterium]
MDKDTVLKQIKADRIQFVELWFVDILGQLKTVTITPDELEKALDEGIGFDGSSIEGFARIFESDLILKPEPETYLVLPWAKFPTARFFCSIFTPEGKFYDGDSRYVLKRYLKKIKNHGYVFNVGPELEFFYFKAPGNPDLLDQATYFDFIPADIGSQVRNETVSMCAKMGIKVEAAHHEVAPSQHEIDIRYADALVMADMMVTLKILIKQVAASNGIYATFMPKPLFGQNGSGLHIHQSLFKDGKNAFYDGKDSNYLSSVAKSYTAGLLKYIKEITSVCNQWVNSYKRLVPGFEAPVYISWGRKNRSALVRVPIYKPGKESASRVELRSPDPACNMYLAFTVILAAGFAGIEEKLKLPDAIETDIYEMSIEEKKKNSIETLPGSLIEAIHETEKSALVKEALGTHIFEKFIENKKIEWDKYRVCVSRYEVENYFPVL